MTLIPISPLPPMAVAAAAEAQDRFFHSARRVAVPGSVAPLGRTTRHGVPAARPAAEGRRRLATPRKDGVRKRARLYTGAPQARTVARARHASVAARVRPPAIR